MKFIGHVFWLMCYNWKKIIGKFYILFKRSFLTISTTVDHKLLSIQQQTLIKQTAHSHVTNFSKTCTATEIKCYFIAINVTSLSINITSLSNAEISAPLYYSLRTQGSRLGEVLDGHKHYHVNYSTCS